MSVSFLRLSLCGAVMGVLAGCGGGSNGGSGGGGGNGGGGGSPTTVTVDFSGSADTVAPSVVATQVGTAAYTQATLASGKVTITLSSGENNFAVAYVCPPLAGENPPPNSEYIYASSTLDGTSLTRSCPASSSTPPQVGVATLDVNAAAYPQASWVAIDNEWFQWTASTIDFNQLMNVGTYDMPVAVFKGNESFDNYLAVRILRNQTVPGVLNGGEEVVLGASDAIVPQSITYTNPPSGFSATSPLVIYYSSGGASIVMDLEGLGNQYLSIPSASFQSGDYYLIETGVSNFPAGNEYLGITKYLSSNGPLAITPAAPWSYSGPTAAALPTFNYVYSGYSGMAEVAQNASIEWTVGTGSENTILITATENHQGGSTALTIPDLSSLKGFIAPAPAGTTVNWGASVSQGSLAAGTPPSGTLQYAETNGTYVEP